MTEKLYRDDPEAVTCTATVTASGPAGFETDRTVFYAMSGGQAGDTGRVLCGDGRALAVTDTVHPGRDRDRILHCLAEGDVPPAPGETVRLELDAQRHHAAGRVRRAAAARAQRDRWRGHDLPARQRVERQRVRDRGASRDRAR